MTKEFDNEELIDDELFAQIDKANRETANYYAEKFANEEEVDAWRDTMIIFLTNHTIDMAEEIKKKMRRKD